MRNPSQIYKIIFISYFIILCLHFKLSNYVEIYPSLVFPAFAAAPKISDNANIPVVDFYAIKDNGGLQKLKEDKFFYNLYYKHTDYFLNTLSKNEAKFKGNRKLTARRTAFINYAQERLKALYGNQKFAGLFILKGKRAYSTIKEKLNLKVIDPQKTFIYFHEN